MGVRSSPPWDNCTVAFNIAPTIAGTSTVLSDAIDTAGYEGIWALVEFGTAADNNTISVAQCATAGGSYADLAGTSVDVGTSASNEQVWVGVTRPTKRYLKVSVLRGTSTTIVRGVTFLWGARSLPVDNTTAGTIAGEAHASPAEGTA